MRKLIVLALAAAVLLAGAVVATGAVNTTLSVKPSPNKASAKKKVRPISLAIDLAIADPALEQPPPLKKVVIRFNEGGVFNGKRFPKCSFSKLQANGTRACPRGSRIGTGTASASAKPIIDLVNAQMTIFNGQLKGGKPTVLLYSVPDISSPITVEGVLEKRSSSSCGDGGRCDYALVFDVPDLPTLPNAPPASVLTVKTLTKKVFVKQKKRVKGKRRTVKTPLIGAPKKCKGKWVAEGQFTYKDGQSQTVAVSLPCRK